MNNLERIEPHAKRLEDAADKMEAAGIGLHADGGHVAVLRRMAAKMRADAAQGKIPHAFGADADRTLSTIRAAKRQLYELRTPVEACEAAPKNIETVRWLRAELKRMGYDLVMEEKVDEMRLNQVMAGHDVQKRMAIKAGLSSLKLIAP